MKNKLQLIRQIIKEETSKFIKKKKLLEEKSILIKKLNRLNEQWNPDDNYVGNYFVATAPMDEPGETKVHVIGDDQYDEYSEAGWDVEGPHSKKEAEKKMNKIHSSNSQWRYFNENESNKEDNGSLRATLHTLVGNEMKLGKRADMHGGVDWQVEEHKKAEKELEMFLLQNPSMLEFVEEVEEHFLKRLYR